MCDICCGYETGQISEDDYAEHMALKIRAREEKEIIEQQAIDNKGYCFTVDMQAVKLCPSIQASALYYLMKLKVHNYTINKLATGDCSNYWWEKFEGDLETSVLHQYLLSI